jgi:hypothetical protein
MAVSDMLSPALLPLQADGSVDQECLARLKPRHDDSEENIRERLRLWDIHFPKVRPSNTAMMC